MEICAVILAGGEGTRMRSKTPKVLHKILNKPMINYVIDAVKKAGANKLCLVVGSGGERVAEETAGLGLSYAVQGERLGTGHAVMCAGEFVAEAEGDVLILYGDTPLVTTETIEELVKSHRASGSGLTLVSAVLDNPFGYGRIIRNKDGQVIKNVEEKDATEEEKSVREINAGVYCFKAEALKIALSKLTNSNAAGEYYLTDAIEILQKEGYRVDALKASDMREFFGVNSRAQLAAAGELMRDRINLAHMTSGVTIIDPNTTYIDADVTIGQDTIIYPGTILEKGTVIGEECEVGPNTRMTASKLGNRSTAEYSRIKESEIGEDTNVGPFAYIRPDCRIGDNVKIGDFVEVKNSVVGDGCKVSHLTYIGDTDAGKNINFGCGTVTVNYNGKGKFRTVIGDDAFIGCNANLIAPVEIGHGSYIAAGSTINKNVSPDSFAIARTRQENKENGRKKLGL